MADNLSGALAAENPDVAASLRSLHELGRGGDRELGSSAWAFALELGRVDLVVAPIACSARCKIVR